MRHLSFTAALLALLTGCVPSAPKPPAPVSPVAPPVAPPVSPPVSAPSVAPGSAAKSALVEARSKFVTKITKTDPAQDVDQPPPEVFQLIEFSSPVGKLAAYVTPAPKTGGKHPAIVWITGGDCNSIGNVWDEAPRSNDQTAAAYRKAGIVMMFPSLRGGNRNPGQREGCLGEVDDVCAAADYLAAQPHVDPQRIYLGGHSTGGTLVMLVAESTNQFRASFAFGPVGDVRSYGGRFIYHNPRNAEEAKLRSPIYWLDSVRTPLFVIEGSSGNPLEQLRAQSKNPLIHFVEVPGVDHFGVLAPANEVIAAKILADTGATTAITLSGAELKGSGS